MKQREFFTRNQVAKLFEIHPRSVYRWEREGKIKPSMYMSGRYPLYTLSDISKAITRKSKHSKTACNG